MVGRATTTAFKTEMGSDTIHPHILIDATFTSGTIYVWNGTGDLSWNGQTYLGAGNLLAISDIKETTDIKVVSLTVTFSALSSEFKVLALDNVELDNDVTIRLGLINTSGDVVADPEILFKGKMDEVEISESGDSSIFELTVNNKLVMLQATKERRYTNEDQVTIYSDDTALRHCLNADKEIKWGSV